MTRASRLSIHVLLCSLAFVSLLTVAPHGSSIRFYRDDPLQREPETQDASNVRDWEMQIEEERPE